MSIASANQYEVVYWRVQIWFLSFLTLLFDHLSFQFLRHAFGRDLKDGNGYVYETVFLVIENQKFLRDHPRKER